MVPTVLELSIEDVAFGGKGVGGEGKAVFIPFTIDGERVTAKIVREKSNLPKENWFSFLNRAATASLPIARTLAVAAAALPAH